MSKDSVILILVSDALKAFEALLDVTVMDFNGTRISHLTLPVTVPANSSAKIPTIPKQQLIGDANESRSVIHLQLRRGQETLHERYAYFRLPKELELHKPTLMRAIQKNLTGYTIELAASTLAKSVMLACGDDACFFSDNYFDLVPGIQKTITVTTTMKQDEFEKSLKIISLIDSYQ
ncbi:MAG: glycoside hydrolase family 2 protein [bacterium]